jgi:RNA polymerase sigma-70 factor (ECF subfamily)
VQDTLVNALQARDQFQAGINLRAWLFTILRNRFFSMMTRAPKSVELRTDEHEQADSR